MSLVNAYITFKGNCREAMNFYKEALGAELTLSTVGQMSNEAKMTEEAANKIMHSSLTINGETLFFASDMFGEEYNIGNAISLCINATSEEQARRFFHNLNQNSKSNRELRMEMWGDMYGEVMDRFGVCWMINFHEEK
jgi:PhnB protein